MNIPLLLLILWIEAPEEFIFRGYIQNHLQDVIGPTLALFAGAFIWAAWHLFDIAEVARIFVYGVALSLVFGYGKIRHPWPSGIHSETGCCCLVLF